MDLLATPGRRRLLFGALYFLEGAPIGFVFWALPTILRARGYAIDDVTALSAALALPWALKFVWAPLVDLARGMRFAERGWIVVAQTCMVLALLPLLQRGTLEYGSLLFVALVVHAVAAATQDVAIDALAVRTSTPAERDGLNAAMNAGMMGGRAVFASGALFLRGRVGDEWIIGALIAVLAAGLCLSFTYRAPAAPRPDRARAVELFGHFARAARSLQTWRLLAFAATSGAAFEALGGMVGPFLLDRGLDSDVAATFFAVPAWACPLVGGLVGAALAHRFGRRRALIATAVLLAAMVAATPWLVPTGTGATSALLALSVVYLAIGAFTVQSYALFMQHTDPALGSTQFSAYMGATNLCESWSVKLGGTLVAPMGYGGTLGLLALVSVLALLLVPRDVAREVS